MFFTKNMKIFKGLLYLFVFNNTKSFVFCQYQSDYFDLDNAISTDGNANYHFKTQQSDYVNQVTDIGETVNIKTQFSILDVENNTILH